MSLGTPTGTQPTTKRPHRQRRTGGWALVILFVLALAAMMVAGVAVGQRQERERSGAVPTATSGAGAFAATATTSPPPPKVRRLGILIMQNIGTGETAGAANRVYFLGRDTKPGPGLRIVPAAIQPVDVDPRPDVRRAVNLPYREIIARAKRGERFHPSPQLVARPGERVEVVLQNRDRILHSFTFDEAVAPDAFEDVPRHKTKIYEFTVPRVKKPTASPYYCRWRQLGMDGLFVVKGPPVPK